MCTLKGCRTDTHTHVHIILCQIQFRKAKQHLYFYCVQRIILQRKVYWKLRNQSHCAQRYVLGDRIKLPLKKGCVKTCSDVQVSGLLENVRWVVWLLTTTVQLCFSFYCVCFECHEHFVCQLLKRLWCTMWLLSVSLSTTIRKERHYTEISKL